MQFSNAQYSFGLKATGTPTGIHVSGPQTIGVANASYNYTTPPDIIYSLALQIANGDTLTLDFATGIVTGTVAGAYQKETATIIAGAGCTSDGNLALVITAVGLAGSPLTVNVPLTMVTHTTQDLIGAQCRTTLAATAAITDFFTVGGATNTFTLEKLEKEADDATMNALIPTARGVTGDATSDNTTAGVAVSMAYKRSGTVWDATDAEGASLATATKLYSTLAVVSGVGDLVMTGGDMTVTVRSGDIDPYISPAGVHPWNTVPVTFEATGGDCLVILDIHAGT